MGPLEQKIVDFTLATSFDDLNEAAIRAARMRVIDSIGVALAAFLAPPVRIARRLAQPTAGPLKSTIWGTGIRTTPEMAAFVNGVMVRYLDLNDAYRTRDAHHPSDYLPGILALTEALGLSGARFIEALAISYEIQCRFTDAVPWNDNGFDQPVSGALGTAMAAGKLLGLQAPALRDALSLALIPNLCTYQTRSGELAMWKGCAGPNGARNGLFAALLAGEGMSGPNEAFDGVFGVWNQTLGKRYDVDLVIGGGQDRVWGLEQSNIKTYAVRDSCQLPIDTARELRANIAASEIRSLRIETYQSAWLGAVKDPELWAPRTRETADHSMLFAVACGLIDGDVTPDSFENGRFRDGDVLDLIGRTEVDVLDAFSAATPQTRNCRIVATRGDGQEIVAHRILTLDEIKRGMSDDDLEAKFHRTAARSMEIAERQRLLAQARQLETLDNVEGLITLIRS
jgi:2-methylcitrate dehydratase